MSIRFVVSRVPLLALYLLLARFNDVCAAAVRGASMAHPKRWLIVSSPTGKSVSYIALSRGSGLNENSTLHTLINGSVGASDLTMPMGVAVDQNNGRLFVADPGQKTIMAYSLHYNDNPEILLVGAPIIWATGVEARWVAVDPAGNVFYTDEANNNIMVIPVATTGKPPPPQIVYSGATLTSVSSPGGIAADSMRVYWVNKQLGSQIGSVMSAPKLGAQAGQNPTKVVLTLAVNTDKSYGLCRSMSNLFYTQPNMKIFGVEASGQGGGNFAIVTDRLVNPRGCAFDGDGTVYVADRGAGAIYSYAGNMQKLGYAMVQKTATLTDAFGTAVFSGTHRTFGSLAGLVLLVAATIRSVIS